MFDRRRSPPTQPPCLAPRPWRRKGGGGRAVRADRLRPARGNSSTDVFAKISIFFQLQYCFRFFRAGQRFFHHAGSCSHRSGPRFLRAGRPAPFAPPSGRPSGHRLPAARRACPASPPVHEPDAHRRGGNIGRLRLSPSSHGHDKHAIAMPHVSQFPCREEKGLALIGLQI